MSELPPEPDPDRMRTALELILAWCEAYPLEVFRDPDIEAARAKLGDAEFTRLNAAWARHILAGIGRIAAGGLSEDEDDADAPADASP